MSSTIIVHALLCMVGQTWGAPSCVDGSCPRPQTSGPALLQAQTGKQVTYISKSRACEYDDSLSPEENLLKALKEKTEGVSYTAEEMAMFELRATLALTDIVSETGERTFIDFFNDFMDGMVDSLSPAVTQASVDEINEADCGWEAAKTAWSTRLTSEEFRNRLGTVLQKPTEEAETAAASLLLKRRPGGSSSPESFDASENWPACADVLAHIRDQGNCGSCWAMAAASSIESRLCIVTAAAFQGYISGGYITSCNAPSSFFRAPDGCNGGYTHAGYALANSGGIPTGTNNVEPEAGCVPYFGSGDYADHWNSKSGAPECPESCTNKGYGIPLQADRYIGTGVASQSSSSQSFAKDEMLTHGPLVMAYTVYDDFMSYSSGVYTQRSNSKAGGHAVMCSGWGKQGSTPYLQCSNSWGTDWGESGRFRIKWGECDMYYEAGWMSDTQPALDAEPGEVVTAAPTPAQETGACCGESCVLTDDCNQGMFCCPNHNVCMDRLTKSTAGPMCIRCSLSR